MDTASRLNKAIAEAMEKHGLDNLAPNKNIISAMTDYFPPEFYEAFGKWIKAETNVGKKNAYDKLAENSPLIEDEFRIKVMPGLADEFFNWYILKRGFEIDGNTGHETYSELKITDKSIFKFCSIKQIEKQELINAIRNKAEECRSEDNADIRLPQPVIALFYYYSSVNGNNPKNKPITGINCNEVANEYGYTAKNSGKKILQLFNKFQSHINERIGQGKTSIKRLAKVCEMLKSNFPAGYKIALEELKSARRKIN